MSDTLSQVVSSDNASHKTISDLVGDGRYTVSIVPLLREFSCDTRSAIYASLREFSKWVRDTGFSHFDALREAMLMLLVSLHSSRQYTFGRCWKKAIRICAAQMPSGPAASRSEAQKQRVCELADMLSFMRTFDPQCMAGGELGPHDAPIEVKVKFIEARDVLNEKRREAATYVIGQFVELGLPVPVHLCQYVQPEKTDEEIKRHTAKVVIILAYLEILSPIFVYNTANFMVESLNNDMSCTALYVQKVRDAIIRTVPVMGTKEGNPAELLAQIHSILGYQVSTGSAVKPCRS